MKNIINIIVGNNIRKERLKQSLSQERLATLSKVHRTYIGIVERAEGNITLVSLEKISKALKVYISELLK